MELIKTIKNETEFVNIILLKDGRLCSIDKFANLKIYNKNSFYIEIEINDNNEETKGNIGYTSDNLLLFLANDTFNIIDVIDSKNYKIKQSFKLPKKCYDRIIQDDHSIEVYNSFSVKNEFSFCSTGQAIRFEKIGDDFKMGEIDEVGGIFNFSFDFWEYSVEDFLRQYFFEDFLRKYNITINGSYYIRNEDIFYVLNKNKILIYHS